MSNKLDSQSLLPEQLNKMHIRSSFLKHNTREDAIKLFQNTPQLILRGWCTDASLSPSGNLCLKSSYVVPLVDAFWQRFQFYHATNLDDLHNTASSVSPRAGTHNGLIYDLLQAVPGSFYPAEARLGFQASDFSSPSRLHAVQPVVYDSSGNLVLPKDLESVLTVETVEHAEVCFGAWMSSNKGILVRFLCMLSLLHLNHWPM
jgi:hypothetical protein